MPTKLNSAGNQQNYVPAGNGDASGEYGDNASGSNKHFTNFAKPESNVKDNPKDNVIVKQIGDKPVNAKPKKTIEDLNNALQKTLGGKLTPNGKKLIKNIGESDADPRYVSLMANLYETENYQLKLGKNYNSKYEYSTLGNYKAVILGKDSLDGDENYVKGETFFHESGHALDHTSKGLHRLYSMDYKSKKYGMSLQESVNDELKDFIEEKKYDELHQEVQSFQDDILKANNKLQQQHDKFNDAIKKYDAMVKEKIKEEIIKKIGFDRNTLNQKIRHYEIEYEEYKKYSDEMYDIEDKIREDYKNSNEEYKQLRDGYNSTFNKILENERKAVSLSFKKYGDLSDMIQAINGKQLCGGHERGYFKRPSNQATECFAEITSAKAVNKESYNMLKKYIPRTLEIYEEIIGEIENE